MEEKGNCTRLSRETQDAYVRILRRELIPAMGCTEPIALAYAAAKAAELLGERPARIEVWCSGNMIKNVKAVNVPNSGGLRGINAAAALGALGGNAAEVLNVLASVTAEDIAEARKMVEEGRCSYSLAEDVPNLYIKVAAHGAGDAYATVVIENRHTNITLMEKNGEVLHEAESETESASSPSPDMETLNLADILAFAETVDISEVEEVIRAQIAENSAIADEGLRNPYGLEVGRSLLRRRQDVQTRARARAAAGSDARMSGCPMPVVINSGSGNQGMTVSLPVIEYAREDGAEEEKLIRALVISNLISLHQKRYIGSLSAYCGATSAAVGAACGVAWLRGADYDTIAGIITNTTATIGGMVCDGAKPSCAAKISAAVGAALESFTLSEDRRVCRPGEGLVGGDVEQTIRNIGRMGREGMRSTDTEILRIMTETDV